MSKIVIIAVIIGIIIIGSAAVLLASPDQPVELNDESETSVPEPVIPKGRDIQIYLEDSLNMESNP